MKIVSIRHLPTEKLTVLLSLRHSHLSFLLPPLSGHRTKSNLPPKCQQAKETTFSRLVFVKVAPRVATAAAPSIKFALRKSASATRSDMNTRHLMRRSQRWCMLKKWRRPPERSRRHLLRATHGWRNSQTIELNGERKNPPVWQMLPYTCSKM